MIEKLQFGESVHAILGAFGSEWNVLAVLEGPNGKLVIPGKNIITNNGDLYYAQRGAAETPTNDFTAGGLRMGTGVTAVAKTDNDVTTFFSGGGIAETATYPKTNDADADNTGAGTDIITWLFTFTTAQGNNGAVAEGAIVDNITTPTVALCHFLFAAPFAKTSSNTLKVFVNHTANGV